MDCLHPFCPAGYGAGSWQEVLALVTPAIAPPVAQELMAVLDAEYHAPAPLKARTPLPASPAIVTRIARLAPCLFNQIDRPASARSIVHFCELSLGEPITSANIHQAFLIQHPRNPAFNPGPARPCGSGVP